MASINILDETHQWFKNGIGAEFPINGLREDAMCNIAIQNPTEILVIPDTKHDDRVNQTTWVINNIIRFYAGAPLVTTDGLAVGTLCVYDKNPRSITQKQQEILKRMARIVSRMLEK